MKVNYLIAKHKISIQLQHFEVDDQQKTTDATDAVWNT